GVLTENRSEDLVPLELVIPLLDEAQRVGTEVGQERAPIAVWRVVGLVEDGNPRRHAHGIDQRRALVQDEVVTVGAGQRDVLAQREPTAAKLRIDPQGEALEV